MKRSILYVDDEPGNLRAFVSVFRRDYDIFITESPLEGLHYLSDHDVDLIITDLRMSEMSGVEFLKRVHKLFPKVPPIRMILSGYSTNSAINEAKEKYSLSEFIAKPWEPDELKKKMDDAINESFT